MGASIRRNLRPTARAVVVLLVLSTMLVPATPKPALAAQDTENQQLLDLPGMALTPSDLAGAGQDGYLVLSAQTVGGEQLAATIGEWTDQMLDDDILATLEEAGLGWGYQFGLRLRQDPDDPLSDLARDLNGSLFEFSDEDGAAEGFDLLDELSAEYEGVERVEGDEEIGDAAALIRPVPEADSETQRLVIAFRAGRLIAVLGIMDYLGGEPDTSEAEELGGLLLERIIRRRQHNLYALCAIHNVRVRHDVAIRIDDEP